MEMGGRLQALTALPPKTEAPVRFGYKAVWTFWKFVTPADTRTPDLPAHIIAAREITPFRLFKYMGDWGYFHAFVVLAQVDMVGHFHAQAVLSPIPIE